MKMQNDCLKNIGENHHIKLNLIRKQTYDYHKDHDRSPYTWFKARYYMENASLWVYLLQFTPIHPNIITILYSILGILGSIMLLLPDYTLSGVIILYNKGILDWADGHLARIKGKTSDLGRRLDNLAGKVGTRAFYACLALYMLQNLYIYERISIIWYLLLPLVIIRAFQERKYIFSGRASSVDFFLLLVALDKLFFFK